MKLIEGLTFDDVLLVPQFSDITSRSKVDISTKLGSLHLDVPILSANMDTITDFNMAVAMQDLGGLGVLHRYVTTEQMLEWVQNLRKWEHVAIPSVGIKDEDFSKAEKYREYTDSVCVDIAHGNSVMMCVMVVRLVNLGYKNIIAGNVANGDGARRLIQAGANIIKVGVGPGSVCTTRIVTGHGFPQLSAVEDAAKACNESGAYLVADGGIRSSGDIVKALAAGADAVMLGGMFAGYIETPSSSMGVYRGMASREAQVDFKGSVGNSTAEGVSIPKLENKGSITGLMEELAGGIRSGLTYSGCMTIAELQKHAIFVRITSNGLIESHPHGKSP